MKLIVLDTESDDLYKRATKIHVMSWTTNGKDIHSTDDYNKMKEVVNSADLIVCHNAIGHDMPLFEKILGIPMDFKKYADSLAISRYLFPDRKAKGKAHGLASWGNDVKVAKPDVKDWKEGSYEQYKHRCEEDVKINYEAWRIMYRRLNELYPTQADKMRIINYLGFKMDCMREQEDIGWKINKPLVEKHLETLSNLQDDRVQQLSVVMPQVPKYKTKEMPAKGLKKKDGTYSVAGQKWIDLLEAEGLPKDHTGPVEVLDHMDPPNPNSPDQLKDWLFSLGWKPSTFKYLKNKDTGKERAIPQIKKHKELCPSVERLAEKVEEVKLLSDLAVIQHRLGIFKSLLQYEEDGWIEAKTSGFTNTLRFTHASPAVNLPGVDKPWGKEVRECFIAPSRAHKLCGADVSSLEATTKAHYITPYDPDYAKELTYENFDEHLDLARQNGVVTNEEYTYYSENDLEGDEKWDKLHVIRKSYKPVNYSAVYGVGKVKLSRETDMPEAKCEELLNAYWDRNWAVKELVKHLETKNVGGITWLFNPVSKFWYELRFDKDRFSTLNQSTGVFLFDSWVARVRAKGIQVCAQFHDEIVFWTTEEERDKVRVKQAIGDVNKTVDLNVTIDVDVKFGASYAEIH